jgi:hypothetical protein
MAPILESFFAKTMVNTYLRKRPLICYSMYSTGEKQAMMIIGKLMNKVSFEDVVESSLIQNIINTYIVRDIIIINIRYVTKFIHLINLFT